VKDTDILKKQVWSPAKYHVNRAQKKAKNRAYFKSEVIRFLILCLPEPRNGAAEKEKSGVRFKSYGALELV
jgi:hypothetical protein